MFGAAAAALAVADRADDVAGACLAAHYAALAHLTDPDHAKAHLAPALELAHRSADARLVTLVEAFDAVADLSAGRRPEARAAVVKLDHVASEDGYDSFLVHWAGWMAALAERDAAGARHWMGLQQDYLDRTGIVETWITSFSTALCDAVEGGDYRPTLSRARDLAGREGFDADPDCVLVLSYAEMCAGRFEVAAELLGTAMHERFNATAHYVLYVAVLDGVLRDELDAVTSAEAMARGRGRRAADALVEYDIVAPTVTRGGLD
jgi:hypothetical protein